jgi:hypothetical protein
MLTASANRHLSTFEHPRNKRTAAGLPVPSVRQSRPRPLHVCLPAAVGAPQYLPRPHPLEGLLAFRLLVRQSPTSVLKLFPFGRREGLRRRRRAGGLSNARSACSCFDPALLDCRQESPVIAPSSGRAPLPRATAPDGVWKSSLSRGAGPNLLSRCSRFCVSFAGSLPVFGTYRTQIVIPFTPTKKRLGPARASKEPRMIC